MSSKRKKDSGVEELSGRERKKQRVAVARTIAVQSVPSPAPNVPPSTILPTISLPSVIDVEKFVEARAFEIQAMQIAMKSASSSSTQRAWQALPRHLRRRAASHDIRRVPSRLREKAREEMDPMQKKSHPQPKRGKTNRISRTDSFLRRQCDKVWLETHIWHAKRMKMENMWGYRLAVQPTEKAYRPSHRASIHGSILHDASYFSLIELRGQENILIRTLELCCDPQGPGPGSKRCLGGARTLDTHIYEPSSFPFGLIAPISIIWKPVSVSSGYQPILQLTNTITGRKGKTTNGAETIGDSIPRVVEIRTVWLRFHPSVNEEVKISLQNSASQVLQTCQTDGDPPEVQLEITDLKDQINVFEIMGPKASQVIKGALGPASGKKREVFSKFWSSLSHMQTSGSVPRGMIIGFTVNDPRLKFPPSNAKSKSSAPSTVNPVFPSSTLALSQIWDESIRLSLAKPRYTKKNLDDRRAKNLIPGTPLSSMRQDDRIPILLVQRSLETPNSSESQSLHGWTLIVPAGWGMPFFSSLIFTGTRVGGQRERQTQAYEAGTPYFPRDYPFTAAYRAFAAETEEELRGSWERKPPAKRVNFYKLETSRPWSPNWNSILDLPEVAPEDQRGFVSSQRENESSRSDNAAVSSVSCPPWLLRGAELSRILDTLSSMFIQSAGLLAETNRLRVKRSLEPLNSNLKAPDLLKSALISIRVTMCSRGTPEDLSVIYSMEDEEVRQCLKAIQMGVYKTGGLVTEETELTEPVPWKRKTIGRITTGHFSLSRGEGFAIGAIPLACWLELEERFKMLHPTQGCSKALPLVRIRNVQGQRYQLARVEVLLDGFP